MKLVGDKNANLDGLRAGPTTAASGPQETYTATRAYPALFIGIMSAIAIEAIMVLIVLLSIGIYRCALR